ncbi:hypothetical protein C8Q80DRAFT_1208238 [Daedaleopsis nitida]|nr:hypothetical protein C8Q80DRAFT_1208238 [Daedaleopsis nitida]
MLENTAVSITSATASTSQAAVDFVLRYVYDKATLKSCALVCKAWVAPSHWRIFRSFFATPERSSWNSVLSFLNNHLSIASGIKHLCLDGYSGVSLHDLETLFDNLPSLHTLQLDNILISKPLPHQGTITTTSRSLRKVTISMQKTPQDNYDTLFLFLALFTNIRELQLVGSESYCHATHSRIDQPLVCTTPFPPNLRISTLTVSALPLWLLKHVVCSSRLGQWGILRELRVQECFKTWEDVSYLGTILCEVGAHLRRLFIGPSATFLGVSGTGGHHIPSWMRNPSTRPRWDALRLDMCTNLDVFGTRICFGDRVATLSDPNALLKTTLDMLAHVPRTVRAVYLDVFPGSANGRVVWHMLSDPATLKTLDWPAVDELLSGAEWGGAKVVLELGALQGVLTDVQFSESVDFLVGALHRIRRRGRLVISTMKQD